MCVFGSVLARVSRGPRTKFSPMSARLRGVLRLGEARFLGEARLERLFAGSSAPGCRSVVEGGPGGALSGPEAAGGCAGGSARTSLAGLPSLAALGLDDDADASEAAGGGTFGNRSGGDGGGCIDCCS